ncbi:hypothetical protein MAR_007425 [Mya arenaria]|uniref:Death domain-containing protein n=1 Tax=Mya arenaria TaxID=6604 RepID=A0ABY7DEV1_MYAAR|nr:uncharacterized protein LOC128237125 [Mya arenaria]XP_052808337.1 uncharacterized protein LOC128237125 [Mya arenaria]XP_052808342.1 uncharacterized protein LOC128237125 [Mya arenaria]WAQ94954.1 hypothetical protein MAR_007425 [Mya arenaria]
MPPATSLQFFRKKQSVDQFGLERPQSLPIFRDCVAKELVSTERRIELLRQSYYGPSNEVEQDIKRWLDPLSRVLSENRISYFLCKSQLDDAVYKFRRSEGDPTLAIDFDKEAVKIVMDIVDRVMNDLKTGFADIIKELKTFTEYMWKYCLSFSSSEGDIYLDTALNYERQRKEFLQAINFNLNDIVNMAEQFETKGMRVQDLGFVARDLAERCKATHAPFLVIIPQAFENLKNAIAGIRKWLEADEGYADFIHYDVREMEQKKDAHEKVTRELQTKCSNSEHKLKTARRHLADIAAEVKSFEAREVVLLKEKNEVLKQLKDIQDNIEIKTYRKEEMKQRLEELKAYELDSFKQVERDITELNDKKPVFNRRLEDINKKLETINERKQQMTQREHHVIDTKAEVKRLKKEFRKCEVEQERIEGNLSRLREILRYKTAPEVLKKIFHGMPLTARHVVNKGKRPLMDKLERSCKITASNIDHDWCKLYRALPFHPPRGEETISNDIDEINKEYMRTLSEEMCRQSLWRWRRMHTRASLEDLKKALLSIRRKDIIDLIEEDIMRRASKPNIPSPAFRTVRFPKLHT